MKENVARLLSRYQLFYYREDQCVEYFILDRRTKKQISYAIVFSLNTRSKQIHVSRFCPELYKQIESKYLSAACFYLLISHFGSIYHVDKGYNIHLETRPETYERFFSRLKDFCLDNKGLKLCETVEVCGEYPLHEVDTSMIHRKPMSGQEVGFRV
jgi:hypothetical protein